MDHDKPGAGQGDLPPREGQSIRPSAAADRPTITNLTQVAGSQYLLTTQPQGVPPLAQLCPAGLQNVPGGVTRIINISPSRGETSPLRPSMTNQSIVNVLTKSPTLNIHNLQLIQSNDGAATSTAIATTSGAATPTHSRGVIKRSLISSPEKKDYAGKQLKVLNHRTVKSKFINEKFDEQLAELYLLESGGNILDLVQFQKMPKSEQYLNYIREHSIDDTSTGIFIPHTTPSTPTATATSSLPGISSSNSSQLQPPTKPVPRMNQHLTSTVVPSLDNITTIKATTATSSSSQESIVEKAKQEAFVLQRIGELQKEGLWSEKRLPKVQEKPRAKAHWDFAIEELMWLSTDFAQERKWKKINAKKCSRMVQKYFQEKALAAQRAEKAFEQQKKKLAAFCAKEIRNFWSNVEKLVEYRQNTILEEKRQRVIDHHLSFIVDQTEKYTRLLAEGMNKPAAHVPSTSNISSQRKTRAPSDDDFCPSLQSDEDDEETIEKEEAAPGNEDQSAEVEALKKESQMELDDLLEDDLLMDYLLNRDNIRLSSDDSDDETQEPARATDSEEFDSVEESDTERIEGSQTENQSIKMLLDDQKWEGEKTKTDDRNDLLNNATAIAESIQPKGNTLSSTTVSTKVPFLLQLPLREYQHIGLDWLVTMYERKLNGILADEMGLGKTIQTIALLAHLACEKGNWGPHLIIVPTSVMLNWEMECKKWCPGFKILTYYGPHKERKQKRRGWTKHNAFHICITSYKLVIQDHQSFRRKKWKYLILDEAQNIKNFKSQRWQLLLNFQSERRLLLTGTPLQNNLMELWSLMHFLMPSIFQSHREFKEWFSNPVSGMIEGNSEYNDSIIKRLHKVLRPFLLRRLKSEVEKQMPKKYEHIKMCRLSNRQRYLYDDFMSRAKTRETLASGNLLSVINVLMQLRKVCNHPNLFEVRPTLSPFQCDNIKLHIPSIVYSALLFDVFKHVNLYTLNLLILMAEFRMTSSQYHRMRALAYRTVLKPPSPRNQPPPGTPAVRLRMRVVRTQRDQRPPQLPQQVSHNTMAGQSISRTRVASRDINTVVRNVGIPVVGMDVAGNSILRVASSSGIHVASSSGMHVVSSSSMQVAGGSGIQVASSSGMQVVTTGVINTGMQVVSSGVVTSTMQVVSQGLVKTVPMLTFSQAAGQGLVSPINVASVLKHGDRASNYAQIVQTPTGKHLLLTASPSSGGNSPVTHTAQKVMFLSAKQAIIPNSNSNLTSPNGNQIITRAYGRLSLTPITTNSLAPLSTASPSGIAPVRGVGPVRSTLPLSGIESTSSIASTSGIASVRGITPITRIGGITPISGITPLRGLPQTSKIAATRNIHDSGAGLTTSLPSTNSASNCTTSPPRSVTERPRNPCFDFLDEIYPTARRPRVRTDSEEEDIPDQSYRKRVRLMSRINRKRCLQRPLYGGDLVDCMKVTEPSTTRSWTNGRLHCLQAIYGVNPQWTPQFLKEALYTPVRRIHQLQDICDRFIIYIPSAKADEPDVRVWHPPPSEYQKRKDDNESMQLVFRATITPLHRIATMMVTQFPDRRLIQYDCGKLQMLDRLLRNLKNGGHRVLIFTQMTKMLDVLEAFLNCHGHIYLRLDGTTKVEQRQILMERFNSDKRIFVFILSTRSGGVGVNLTGADTVIFYDSDWNPTMDAQAQDRCHRIGQTRDVHIYRLISEKTIEENILKKANQKRLLGNLAIEGGNFTTAYFKNNTSIVDLFNIDQTKDSAAQRMSELVEKRQDKEAPVSDNNEDEASALENALAACEDDQDVQATKIATAEAVAELAEFDENIPLDHEEKEKEPEISKAQQTINDIIKTLTPVEKYAMQFLELTESTLSAEYLAAEERRIEEQKRIWEINQIATIREQEEKRQREIEEENLMLTYSREDATNQVSFKNKIVAKGENVLKRSRRGGGRKTRSPSQPKSKKPRCEDGESSTLDLSKENLKPSEITSSSDKLTSDSDTNDQLSLKKPNNHLANPRLRSRGTVDIDLWTLDVNPILPGVKPLKNNKPNRSYNDNKSDNKKHKQVFEKEEKDLSDKNNKKRDKDLSIKAGIHEDIINTSDEDKWLADTDEEFEAHTKTDRIHGPPSNRVITKDADEEDTFSETDNINQIDEIITSDTISGPPSYQIAVEDEICNSSKQLGNEESGEEADESDLEDETNFKATGVSDSRKCESKCDMENKSQDLVEIKDLRVILTDICRDVNFQIPEIISTSVRSNSMDTIDLGKCNKAEQDGDGSEDIVPKNNSMEITDLKNFNIAGQAIDACEEIAPQNNSMKRIGVDKFDIAGQEDAKSDDIAPKINSMGIIDLQGSNNAGQKSDEREAINFENNSMSFDNAKKAIDLEKSNKPGSDDKGEAFDIENNSMENIDLKTSNKAGNESETIALESNSVDIGNDESLDIGSNSDTCEPIQKKSMALTDKFMAPIKGSTELINNSMNKSSARQNRDESDAVDVRNNSLKNTDLKKSSKAGMSRPNESIGIIDLTPDSDICDPIQKRFMALMIESSEAGQSDGNDLRKLRKAGLQSDKSEDAAFENNSMEVSGSNNESIDIIDLTSDSDTSEPIRKKSLAFTDNSTTHIKESKDFSINSIIKSNKVGQNSDVSEASKFKDISKRMDDFIESNRQEMIKLSNRGETIDESENMALGNKSMEIIRIDLTSDSDICEPIQKKSIAVTEKSTASIKESAGLVNNSMIKSRAAGQNSDEAINVENNPKKNTDLRKLSKARLESDKSADIALDNNSVDIGGSNNESIDIIDLSSDSNTSEPKKKKSLALAEKSNTPIKESTDLSNNPTIKSNKVGPKSDVSEASKLKDFAKKTDDFVESVRKENLSNKGEESDKSEDMALKNSSMKIIPGQESDGSFFIDLTSDSETLDAGNKISPENTLNKFNKNREEDKSTDIALENNSMEVLELDNANRVVQESAATEDIAPESDSITNSQESGESEDFTSKNNSMEIIDLDNSSTAGQESEHIALENDSNKTGQETDESDGSGSENNSMEVNDSDKSSIAGQESDESDDVAHKSNSTINSQESSDSEDFASKNNSPEISSTSGREHDKSEHIFPKNDSNEAGEETDESDRSTSKNSPMEIIDSDNSSTAEQENDKSEHISSTSKNSLMEMIDSDNSSTAGQEDDESEHIAPKNDSNKAGKEIDDSDSSTSKNSPMEIIDSDNSSTAGQESDTGEDIAPKNDNKAGQETDESEGSASENNSMENNNSDNSSIAGQESDESDDVAPKSNSTINSQESSESEDFASKNNSPEISSTSGQEHDKSEHISPKNDSSEAGQETDESDSCTSKNSLMEIIDSDNSSTAGQEVDESEVIASKNDSNKASDTDESDSFASRNSPMEIIDSSIAGQNNDKSEDNAPQNDSNKAVQETDYSDGSASENNSNKNIDLADSSTAGQEEDECDGSASENTSIRTIDSDNSSTSGQEDDESEHIAPKNYSNKAGEETDETDSGASKNTSMEIIDSDNSSNAGQEDDENEDIAPKNDSDKAGEETDENDSFASKNKEDDESFAFKNNSMEIIDSDSSSTAGQENDESEHIAPKNDCNKAGEETDESDRSTSKNSPMEVIDLDNSSTAGQEDDESEHIDPKNYSNKAGKETDESDSSTSRNSPMEIIDSDNSSTAGQEESDESEDIPPKNDSNKGGQETDESDGSASENTSMEINDSDNSSIAGQESDESDDVAPKSNSSEAGQETDESDAIAPEKNSIEVIDLDDPNIAGEESDESEGSASKNNSMDIIPEIIDLDNSNIAAQESDESGDFAPKNNFSHDTDEIAAIAPEKNSMEVIDLDQECDEIQDIAPKNYSNRAAQETDKSKGFASINNSMKMIDSEDIPPKNDFRIASQEHDEIAAIGPENNSTELIELDDMQVIAPKDDSNKAGQETDTSEGVTSKNNSLEVDDWSDGEDIVPKNDFSTASQDINSGNHNIDEQESNESQDIAAKNDSNKTDESNGFVSKMMSREIIEGRVQCCWSEESSDESDDISPENTSTALRKPSLFSKTKQKRYRRPGSAASELIALRKKYDPKTIKARQRRVGSKAMKRKNNPMKMIVLKKINRAAQKSVRSKKRKIIDSKKSDEVGQESDESFELDLSSDPETPEATRNMSMPINKRCMALRSESVAFRKKPKNKSKGAKEESIESICLNSSQDLHDDNILNVENSQKHDLLKGNSTTRNGKCISSIKPNLVNVSNKRKKSLKAGKTFPEKDHDNITDCTNVAGASRTRSGLLRKYIPSASQSKKSTNNKKNGSGKKH